jgi:hypothetical protein
MVEEITLERSQFNEVAASLTKDAPERAFRPSTNLFTPRADLAYSPEADVAQRLIVLSLTGLADELTWASY